MLCGASVQVEGDCFRAARSAMRVDNEVIDAGRDTVAVERPVE